jgi:6,7-dimethyl-8-ribityllumazine synthase
MITKIHVYTLRVGELLQFLYDVLTECKQKATEAMKLAAATAALQTDTEAFDKHFKLSPGSPITLELIALDDRRDDSVVGLGLVLEGYMHHFDAVTKKAAQDLLWNMGKYGPSIAKLNLPTETSTINSFLQEWTADTTLAAAVTTLNLTAWTTELKTANNLFNEKYIARSNDKGSAPQIKTVEARKKAVNTYRNLITKIEGGAVFPEGLPYDALVNGLNAIINKYNILADSHKKEKDEEEPPK